MKSLKRILSGLIAVLLVIGVMAGSVLPASAASVAGDVNSDGVVDVRDVLITLRVLNGKTYAGAGDFNVRGMFVSGDSYAETDDAVLLLRHVAGWEDAVLTAPADSVKDAAQRLMCLTRTFVIPAMFIIMKTVLLITPIPLRHALNGSVPL